MQHITDLLFWISNGLLVPVVIGLLFFFFKSLIQGGGFFSQYLSRNKQGNVLKKKMDGLKADELPQLIEELKQLPSSFFFQQIIKIYHDQDQAARINKIISE